VVQQAPVFLGTDIWLEMWLSSLTNTGLREIPFAARSLHTFLHFCMVQDVGRPPKHILVQFIWQGLCQGFHIGFTKLPESLKSAQKNLEGKQQCSQVVNEYLSEELATGQVVGPFPLRAVLQVHISQFGVISKGQTGKWRLIVDLSHPRGHSVTPNHCVL